MGSPPDEPGRGADETQHPVTLTRPFYISVTETTCAQYGAWDATHRCGTLYDVLQLDGPSLPVTRISASEIRAYSEWLATKDPGRAYRLPTDAEWECACRAGSPEAHPWGADVAESVKHANVPDASFRARLPKSFTLTDADDGHASSSPAGSFLPNRWGLCDMIGNALEFTSDAHKPHDAAPAVDPASPATGPTGHSLRGGGMGSSVSLLRAASRVAARSERGEDTGFRLVCDIPTK
ncbi:MAG: hypothetical protein HMLKMBBP_02779 [Planctomycetes bacterium]|nr:hypothetical protein [Planctomycetota bacterium]